MFKVSSDLILVDSGDLKYMVVCLRFSLGGGIWLNCIRVQITFVLLSAYLIFFVEARASCPNQSIATPLICDSLPTAGCVGKGKGFASYKNCCCQNFNINK